LKIELEIIIFLLTIHQISGLMPLILIVHISCYEDVRANAPMVFVSGKAGDKRRNFGGDSGVC
jgi:hypothetical protein